MSNKQILIQLLSKLEEYLKRLQFLQKYTKEEFVEDWQIEVQIERMMQLAIECSIDIGEEILSGVKARIPQTYKETFLLLHQNKVLSLTVRKKMEGLSEFRNELVHDYLFLDPEIIYNKFTESVEIIEGYIIEVKKFLK